MVSDLTGAIDCDVHPAAPAMAQLLPFLDDYWRDMMVARGTDGLDLRSYPPNSPLTSRPDWRLDNGKPGSSLKKMQADVLDRFNLKYAVLNCLHGAPALYNSDLSAVLCRAVNDWLAKEWLDQDSRLRASILLPTHNPALAAEEIERRASDSRFVQALMLVQGEMPLGRRNYWPIYEAAERHQIPIAIHAGSLYRNPTTSLGWPSYVVEEYVGQSAAFQHQLLSLLVEGVFTKFPKLKFVLTEAGFTWLPYFMWRAHKTWIALRTEIPWVDRSPLEVIRQNVRVTIQPADAPPQPAQLARICEQIGSDEVLLFSTDYPHWQFDGDNVLPEGIPSTMLDKIKRDNAIATYPRLKELVL
jgi:predicted TIM-barrel fold metal-dependent hydrolase